MECGAEGLHGFVFLRLEETKACANANERERKQKQYLGERLKQEKKVMVSAEGVQGIEGRMVVLNASRALSWAGSFSMYQEGRQACGRM